MSQIQRKRLSLQQSSTPGSGRKNARSRPAAMPARKATGSKKPAGKSPARGGIAKKKSRVSSGSAVERKYFQRNPSRNSSGLLHEE